MIIYSIKYHKTFISVMYFIYIYYIYNIYYIDLRLKYVPRQQWHCASFAIFTLVSDPSCREVEKPWFYIYQIRSDQIKSVTQSCPTLCDAMNRSTIYVYIIHHVLYTCSVQPLSHVQLFATPWTAARQASLSITNSRSLLKLMSITLVKTSNHLILCHSLLLPPSIFPSTRVFSIESVFRIRCQSIGASASASVLPMNIQNWFPLGLTGWISLPSKGLLQHHIIHAWYIYILYIYIYSSYKYQVDL